MPISYIIMKISEILKTHKKEVAINKWQIERVIDLILESNILSKIEEKEIMQDFLFEEEINMFLNDAIYFYEDEEENIVLHNSLSIRDFEYLIEREKTYYDDKIIAKIDNFFDNNIPLIEVFNIKYSKELFNKLCNLQCSIKKEYSDFAQVEMNRKKITEDIMHKAKIMTIKRDMAYNCMKRNLELQEYEDMASYSRYLASINNLCELPLKIKNDQLHNFIINDPFHRALFFLDDNEEFNLNHKFHTNVFMHDEEYAKQNFYYQVLEVLNRRINAHDGEVIMYALINAKYQLMCSIDTIYSNFTPKNYKSNTNKTILDYSFIKNEIYYFIDELLLYTDYDMTDVSALNDYNNTIKSILIEAYFDLTGDEEVIKRIKSNPNYHKEHFITCLFANIINKPKGKIKRKED